MHSMTSDKLRTLIAHYRAVKELATSVEAELLHILVRAESQGHEIDSVKVLGMLRKASADLRGLKAP